MAGNTSITGWPYPSSSDLIAEGATNMQQIDEAVQDQFFLVANKFNSETPYTSFPLGMSMFFTNASDAGFPYTQGQVVTYRQNSLSAWQWFYTYRQALEDQKLLVRNGYTSGGKNPVWSQWFTAAAAGNPTATATGQITLTPPTGGGTVAGKITFPSGRFTKAPRVVTGLQTRQPGDCNASVFDITSSGATIYAYRTGPTTTTVTWIATQGVES